MRAVSIVVAIVLALVLTFSTASSASAERGCVLDILGIKVCGELLTPLPTVTVTLPPPPPVTVKVTVPGPPGPTRTITAPTLPGVPQPTKTVTVIRPGATATTTKTSQPEAGPTIGPTKGPGLTNQSTATKTVTVSPSGQPVPTHGTLGPQAEHKPFFNLDTPAGVSRTVGFGLLSLLALLVIILAGMAYAFRLGRRSQQDEDTNFIREVLDSMKSRGRHS